METLHHFSIKKGTSHFLNIYFLLSAVSYLFRYLSGPFFSLIPLFYSLDKLFSVSSFPGSYCIRYFRRIKDGSRLSTVPWTRVFRPVLIGAIFVKCSEKHSRDHSVAKFNLVA